MKRKILIDIDSTILKSAEEIIRQLNNINNTSYTVDDIDDFHFSNVKGNLSEAEVLNLFESNTFFDNVQQYDGFEEFINKFSKVFDYVLITKGTQKNLEGKQQWLSNLKARNPKVNIEMIGLPLVASKKSVVFDNAYLAIDDYPPYLDEVSASGKILFKGMNNAGYNQTPPNAEYYVVNTWDEISQMVEFDQMLSKEGIKIG